MFRKLTFRVLSALIFLIPTSCIQEQQDILSESENSVVLKLTSPVSMTKTWLDTASDADIYPVYWSDGDMVSVNGTASLPLSVNTGEKLSEAEFLVKNIEAPISIIYPAEAYSGIAEDGRILLSIPSSVTYTDGSFAPGTAIMYGNADVGTSAQMMNLCGAVSLTLSDAEGIRVTEFSVTSLTDGSPVAGEFLLNADGSLEAVSGSSTLTIEIPEEGLPLSPDGTSFIFTIPAGDYPQGFFIRIKDEHRYIQRSFWLRPSAEAEAGVTVSAGKIVEFRTMPYEAQAKEICSAEDWELFAAACNSGEQSEVDEWLFQDGIARLGADIEAENLTPIEEWTGHIDGCGYTLTLSAAHGPLFGRLAGTVENLVIEGTNVSSDPAAGASVFAGTIDGGTIQGCTNRSTLTIEKSSSDITAGVFASVMNSGTIRGCTNEGVVRITSDISLSNPQVTAGGLVGRVAPSSPCLIEDCVNKAALTVIFEKDLNDKHYPLYAGYGGIVGNVTAGTPDSHLKLISCENKADVTATYLNDSKVSTEIVSGVGGILGAAMQYDTDGKFHSWWHRSKNVLEDKFEDMSGIYLELTDCINSGNIYSSFTASCSSDDPTKAFLGGIAGVVNGLKTSHAKIERCSNLGKVIPTYEGQYTRAALSVVSGGLLGFGGYVDLNGCVVRSFQVGTLKWHSYSASGGIGLTTLAFNMTGCEINANVQIVRSTNYSQDNYSLGFTLSTKQNSKGGMRWPLIELEGSSVTGNSFAGSIIYSADIVKYNEVDASKFADAESPITVDESGLNELIASKSFFVDYDGKGFPSQVTIKDNALLNL